MTEFTCQNEGCDNEVPEKRWALGYRTCLHCGSPRKNYVVDTAYNKGGLQVILPSEIRSMGKKTEEL